MVVTDFKGHQPADTGSQTVASSNSGHRQTVPVAAEEDTPHSMLDLPPPYEPYPPKDATMQRGASTQTSTQSGRGHRRRGHGAQHGTRHAQSSRRATSSINEQGYQPTKKMIFDEQEASGYYDKYEDVTGTCCSARGGCCFSDRGGCYCSDHDGCCFSDRGGCCFSNNGGCCFGDDGGCCFSGSQPGKLIPSVGTLFKC